MSNSKIVFAGNTLLDVTDTTAVESDVASGKVFHKADGSSAIGTGTLATACDMYVEDDTGIQTGDLYVDYEESSARQGLINTIWEFHTDITGQYDGTVYSITGTATNGTYTCNAIYQIGNLSYAGVNFFCLWQTGSDNIFAYVPPNGIGLTAGWSWANLQSATASPTAKPTLTITGGSDVGSATLEALLNVIADDLTPSSGGSKLYRKTSGGYTLLQDELPFSVPVEITEANLQSKSVSITSNGSQTVTADAGYDGLSSVAINTNVPQPSGTTTITENGTYDVSSYASADVNVQGGGGATEPYVEYDIRHFVFFGNYVYSATFYGFTIIPSEILSHNYTLYIYIKNTPTTIDSNAFAGVSKGDIYVPWAEGAVANAPWGATGATIHYNSAT